MRLLFLLELWCLLAVLLGPSMSATIFIFGKFSRYWLSIRGLIVAGILILTSMHKLKNSCQTTNLVVHTVKSISISFSNEHKPYLNMHNNDIHCKYLCHNFLKLLS